jgi:hypothetical protein
MVNQPKQRDCRTAVYDYERFNGHFCHCEYGSEHFEVATTEVAQV